MVKIRMAAAILLLAFFVPLAGCSSRSKGKNGEGDILTVNTAVACSGKLTGTTAVSGRLEALNSASVVPKMAGKVAGILVDVGSEVKEGDLMVNLDAADLAALVELYAAQLDKARNADLPAQKNQAELALANAEASFKTAEADFQRSKQLLEASVISRQQFEQYERQYVQAKAACEAARNSLDILVNATIPQTIRQCEAQLEKARADFGNSMIRAPISGIVTARNINPGEMASPTQPVVTLVNLDTVVVQANVSEDQVNYLRVGQEVKVKVSSVQDTPFSGTVTNIALAANTATKAFPVKIQIQNPQHVLKPGMFAEVLLNAREEEGVIIPREAVFSSDGGTFVWVVSSGSVSRREVTTGQSDGVNVVVRSGLTAGEEVAVTDVGSLKEGTRVAVQK